jgi:hypothetical protein
VKKQTKTQKAEAKEDAENKKAGELKDAHAAKIMAKAFELFSTAKLV